MKGVREGDEEAASPGWEQGGASPSFVCSLGSFPGKPAGTAIPDCAKPRYAGRARHGLPSPERLQLLDQRLRRHGHAEGEHVVRPDAERDERDADRGRDHSGVAEDGFAGEASAIPSSLSPR